MTNTLRLAVLSLALAALSACGGDDRRGGGGGLDGSTTGMGSGVDGTKTIPTLTPAEIMALCTYSAEASGGAGTVYMCSDTDITVQTVDDCVGSLSMAPAGCTLTVAEAEDCAEAIGADACSAFGTAACGALITCATGG